MVISFFSQCLGKLIHTCATSCLSLGAVLSLFLPADASAQSPPAPKPLYQSPIITPAKEPRLTSISVDLKGAKELYLVVRSGDSISCDWSDWIEPKLIMADGSTKDLTGVKWKSSESPVGGTQIGRSYGGGQLQVSGQIFRNGIGVHADSSIAYDLPAGAVKFETQVALDDGAMIRSGKTSDASVQFEVYSEKPLPPEVADAGPPLVPLDLFSVPDGLEVTVWAASPMVRNPTNIDFDAQGRLVVAEGVNYRGQRGRDPKGDRIVILEDTKGAGQADKMTVFLQDKEFEAPLGIAVLENQYIVSQPPNLLVFTDTDRNGIFDPAKDKKDELLTGFNGRQHDHSLHSVTVGPDGQWYWNQGNTGAKFTDRSGKTFAMGSPYMLQEIAGQKSDDGHIWIGGFLARMNPDGTQVKILAHNFRNSYEQTVTSIGDIFQSDNDDPPACRVTPVLEGGNAGFASVDGKRSWGADKRPGQDTPTAEWRQEDPGVMPAGDIYGGGSPTGVAYYENGALGDQWRGLLLACEAGKNVVFGYLPKPDGSGFKMERFDFITSNKEKAYAGSDFLGGKPSGELKTKFRPSDVCVGPDGAIYVADWFDARVGGHGTLDKGMTGAIYRIAPKGFKPNVPKLNLTTTEGQLAALQSPAVNIRNSGFTRLKAQGEKAVPAVAALLDDTNPYLAARAIWLLAQMGPSGIAKVEPLLDHKDDGVRLVAYCALRQAHGQDIVKLAAKAAQDSSAAIRRDAAVSLRDIPAAGSLEILAQIAKQYDGKDRTYLEAFGIGATGKEAELYAALSKALGSAPDSWTPAFTGLAWRLHVPAAVPDFRSRALSGKLDEAELKQMLTALAFVDSKGAADAMMEIANTKGFPNKNLAMWWLMNRKNNLWKDYNVEAGMKTLGLYDPDKVKLVAFEMPPAVPNAPTLAPTEIAKLKGNATMGQARVALCYTCHKVGAAGVEFGPDLTTYGRQQTTDVIISNIATPSADISHGFEGSEIKTKDGLTITGMVLSDSDPVMIKCMGGIVQSVPRSRIASQKKLPRSLMYDPAMLGLDAQAIADIAAYLKSL